MSSEQSRVGEESIWGKDRWRKCSSSGGLHRWSIFGQRSPLDKVDLSMGAPSRSPPEPTDALKWRLNQISLIKGSRSKCLGSRRMCK